MDLARPRDIRITCAPALAPWLSEELSPLELPVIGRTKTSVTTNGTWTDTWRLCLELRTALQVLYPLKSFRCRSPEDLYNEARSMAWEAISSLFQPIPSQHGRHHFSPENSPSW